MVSTLKGRRSIIHCIWNGCSASFGDEEDYRRHCAEHIEAGTARIQIHLPFETWAEVLPSCDQKSLVERVCLTRRQFHAIARQLIDGPKGRFLAEMMFLTSAEGDNSILVKCIVLRNGYHLPVELPIAEVPPPRNVVGFSQILVKHFDVKVLSFLCAIRRSLLNNIRLDIDNKSGPFKWLTYDQRLRYTCQDGSNQNNLTVLECLLRVIPRFEFAITSLCIRCIRLEITLISAELLARLLTNVRHLRINGCKLPTPELPSLTGSYSHNCSPHLPVLVKWLHSPREDGHQKLASLNIGRIENLAVLVEQAQQRFLCSTADSTPVPYFVILHSTAFEGAQSVELPFSTLHNECTGEVLSLRYYSEPLVFDGYWHNFVLYRRSCASPPTEESVEAELQAELLTMRRKLPGTLFTTESRNKLVLNVAQMSEIDESQFPVDLEDAPEDGADGNEYGPSNAKRIKSESGE